MLQYDETARAKIYAGAENSFTEFRNEVFKNHARVLQFCVDQGELAARWNRSERLCLGLYGAPKGTQAKCARRSTSG